MASAAHILGFIETLADIVFRLTGVLIDRGWYAEEIESIDEELKTLRAALVDYNAQDQAELDEAVPPRPKSNP